MSLRFVSGTSKRLAARFLLAAAAASVAFSGDFSPLMAQPATLPQEIVPVQRNPLEAQRRPPVRRAPQAAPKPAPQDGVVSRLIASLMPSEHVSGKELDNESSRRALQLYIETFDPLKLYFLQSDVDQFQKYSEVIDDHVRAGNLDLAYYIFEQYTRRVDERVEQIRELLSGEFDFTIDEDVIVDRDAAHYAVNADEARDRWRRQLKLSLLDLMDADEPVVGKVARDQLMRRYDRFAARWRGTSSDDILEMFLTSVTNSYDPHSTYMSLSHVGRLFHQHASEPRWNRRFPR